MDVSDGNHNTTFDDEASQRLSELTAEKEALMSYPHASRLLTEEIVRIHSGKETEKFLELHHDKQSKVTIRVKVPIDEFPEANFVGKILGPKGNTLKRLQEQTGCRMAVLGHGSMRDKNKEEELRRQGGKYAHLNDELHVWLQVNAHPVEAYGRLSSGLNAIRRYLIPAYHDEISQEQMQELAYMNGGDASGGRGAMRGARGGAPFRGRGGPPGPTPPMMGFRGINPRGRGGMPPPFRGGPRGAGPRGPAPRGGPMGRGGAPPSRGPMGGRGMRGSPSGRGGLHRPSAPQQQQAQQPTYQPEATYNYDQTAEYTYEEPTYTEDFSATGYTDPSATETQQSFGYDASATGGASYEDFTADSWDQASAASSYGKAQSVRGGTGDYRSHPYAGGATSTPGRGGARY